MFCWLIEFLQVETSSVCIVMVNYTAYADNHDKWLAIFYISRHQIQWSDTTQQLMYSSDKYYVLI